MGCSLECRGDHHGERPAEVGNLAYVERQFHPGEVGWHSKYVTVPQCGTGVSIWMTRPRATVLHTSVACTSPGIWLSAACGAFPVTFGWPSTRVTGCPQTNCDTAGNACVMASPPRWPVVSR